MSGCLVLTVIIEYKGGQGDASLGETPSLLLQDAIVHHRAASAKNLI